MSGAERIAVRLAEIVPLNDLVTRFEFERTDGAGFPPFSGGAHTVIEMRDGDRRLLGPLRLEAERFMHRFEEHTLWEDRYLRPALLNADAWGQERAARLLLGRGQSGEALAITGGVAPGQQGAKGLDGR